MLIQDLKPAEQSEDEIKDELKEKIKDAFDILEEEIISGTYIFRLKINMYFKNKK